VKKSLFGGKWYIGGTNTRTGETAGITADKARLKVQPWAFTTVECYGCSDCTFLPTNELYFTGMTGAYQGANVPFEWKAFTTPQPKCATKAVIKDSQTVTYSFQK
jgi:hypothetical protein